MRSKFNYIRSKKLVETFRQIPCQHCGADDSTIVAAHSNWSIHGHGKGIKSSDPFCASLCARCHVPILDQGKDLSKIERQQMWWDAHVKTIKELVSRNLWPPNIEPPNIEVYPFA